MTGLIPFLYADLLMEVIKQCSQILHIAQQKLFSEYKTVLVPSQTGSLEDEFKLRSGEGDAFILLLKLSYEFD